jgi:hypothetical protein
MGKGEMGLGKEDHYSTSPDALSSLQPLLLLIDTLTYTLIISVLPTRTGRAGALVLV